MDDSSSEELLRADEIYDMDTATLREKLRNLSEELTNEQDASKQQKLLALADIIALEIEERTLALDFEENCEKILGSLEEVFGNVDQMIEQNRNLYAEPQNRQNEISDNHAQPSKQKNKLILPPIDPERLLSSASQTDNAHNSSRLSRSTSHSRAVTSTQCSEYRIAGHFDAVEEHFPPSRLYPPKHGGKGAWLDFVKNTLGNTKVQNQVISVGQGVFKKPPRNTHHDELRTSRSREKHDRKPAVNPHTIQMESKKKMRETTKAYGESLRKKNQIDSRKHKEFPMLEADTEDVAAISTDYKPETEESAGKLTFNHKPPSIASFSSTDQKINLISRKKNIRVSSNASIPYIGNINAPTMVKKKVPIDQMSSFKENRRGKSSTVGPRDIHKQKSGIITREEICRSVIPIYPEFQSCNPIIIPAELWKLEEHLYVDKVYPAPPLDALDPIFFEFCTQNILITESKRAYKEVEKQPLNAQRSTSRSVREKPAKEIRKKDTTRTQNSENNEENYTKPQKNEKKSLPLDGQKVITKRSDIKKHQETTQVPISKTNTNRRLNKSPEKDDGMLHETKNETNLNTDLQVDEIHDKTPVVDNSSKPSEVQKIARINKKSTRREETNNEESKETDEKRAKINHQIEVWKATKGISMQMRSTSDLRTLLPAPLDYSESFPSWGHLFSETYCHNPNQEADILGAMRDVYSHK